MRQVRSPDARETEIFISKFFPFIDRLEGQALSLAHCQRRVMQSLRAQEKKGLGSGGLSQYSVSRMSDTTNQQIFEIGLKHHQAGRLAEAEAVYRQILARQPRHGNALHLLGLLAHQTGHSGEAVKLIARAVELMPADATCLSNFSEVLRATGRFDDAIATGQNAVRLQPDSFAAHYNLGNALKDRGRFDEAVGVYGTALRLNPDFAEAHNNLGNAMLGMGRFLEAEEAYREAVRLQPNHVMAWNNLGNALRQQGRLDEAIAACRQALQIQPEFAEACNNLGDALCDKRQWDEAIVEYRKAISLKPDYAEAYSNLGGALHGKGQFDEANAEYRTAISLKPDYAEAHSNLGGAMYGKGKVDEAELAFRRAVELKPDFAEAKYNHALLQLLRGELESGWPLYEVRWDASGFTSPKRHFFQPMWDGSPPEGLRVLIHAEQGFGDSIQFVRYAPLVAARGAKVIVECQRALVELFRSIEGVSEVIPAGESLPSFDLHVPMLSQPFVFRTTLETIPSKVPYLFAAPDRCEIWRKRLDSDSPRLKVGLVWAGNTQNITLRKRHISLQALLPLLNVEGLEIVNLQIGPEAGQIRRLPAASGIIDLTGHIQDFADTAALVAQLDLVISVDTAVAHLAGALGRPVWVLLPFVPDWRWLIGRDDSPWYPTMRLFRQPCAEDWNSVIAEVREQLQLLVQSQE